MKKKIYFAICILLILTAGAIEKEEPKEKEPKEIEPYSTYIDPYHYTNTFTVMISDNDTLWIERAEVIDRILIISAKKLKDRTYDGKVYDVPFGMPVIKDKNIFVKMVYPNKEGITESFTYKIPEDVHYIKVGEHSVITIENVAIDTILSNVTAQANFTHLNISELWLPILGSDLVTDGSFDSSTSWGYQRGWSYDATEKEASWLDEDTNDVVNQTVSITSGKKYRVVFSYDIVEVDGSTLEVYIGGTLAGTVSGSNTFKIVDGTAGSTNSKLEFRAKSGGGTTDTIIFDDVSLREITGYKLSNLTLYMPFDSNGSTTVTYDYTDNENDGTFTNDAVYTSSGKYGGGIELDGDEDYISLGTLVLNISKGATRTTWIYAKGVPPTGGYLQRQIHQFWASSTDNMYLVLTRGVDDSLNIDMEWKIGSTLTSLRWTAPSDNNILNNWVHVVEVYNTTDTLIYINGFRKDRDVNSGTQTSASYGTTKIGRQFNGTIDEFMILDTALSREQVRQLYNEESKRFVSTGEQDFNNQSKLNITKGLNTVQVTGTHQANQGSSLDLVIGFYNGTWESTASQIFDGDNTFTISGQSTNLTLNWTFNSGTNDFYTPLLISGVGLTATVTTPCPYDSGNWIVNQYCEYAFLNQNVGGNLTIKNTGTMNCTVSQCNLNFTPDIAWIRYENTDALENKFVGNWTINSYT